MLKQINSKRLFWESETRSLLNKREYIKLKVASIQQFKKE
jgi:hypothetical protein